MECPVKENEYEEGEISDNELPWKGYNRAAQLGLTTEDISIPILPRPCPIVQKGDNNYWNVKGLASEPLEIEGRQHNYRWSAEPFPFSQQTEHFFQMAWKNGVQDSTEDSFKEPSGNTVDGLMRDIKMHKGIVNRLSSFSVNTSKMEKTSLKNGRLLRRVSSWTTNRDFDLCVGRKGGRVAEGRDAGILNFSDMRKTENEDFCIEGKDSFSEDTWQNRLEKDGPLKPGNAERITLRSTIEKVDREDSESDDTEMNKADEKEGRSNIQLDLSEGQTQLTGAAQLRLTTREKEEGELEEGEIQRGSSQCDHLLHKGKADRSLHSGESEKTMERSPEARTFEKSHLRNDRREKRHHEMNVQQRDSDCRFLKCTELVKNVSVRNAQRSFVSVCKQLYSALKILREMTKHIDRPSPRITNLARQAFSGIQAAYAVRNTAIGKEQEKNKDFFPRLLELAYGSCRKLFTSLQVKELENMLQTSGKHAFLSRYEQVEKNYNRDSCTFDSDKAEKEQRPGYSSVNASSMTQLEMESTVKTVIDSKVCDVENSIGPTSHMSPVPAEPQLSHDSYNIPTGIVQQSQMMMASSTGLGWFPLSLKHIEEHDVASKNVTRESTHSSRLVSSLDGDCRWPVAPSLGPLSTASNTQICESTELVGEQKGSTIDTGILHSSSGASDKQEGSTSLVDLLSAITCYHEKFAGKSLMAYTRLPSPTPEEEEESKTGIEVDVSHPSGNQEDATSDSSCQIIDEHQLPDYCQIRQEDVTSDSDCQIILPDCLVQETSGPGLTSNTSLDDIPCDTFIDPPDVVVSETMWTDTKQHQSIKKVVVNEHIASKDPVLIKVPLKSRDPRRKLVKASLNLSVHQNDHNPFPVATDIRSSKNTHVVEESVKMHRADDTIGVKELKMSCVSTNGPVNSFHKGQYPAYSLKPNGGMGENDAASDPIELLKDNEVNNSTVSTEIPSSSNIATKREKDPDVMKRERCLGILLEDLNSVSGHAKRQKVEAVQQEAEERSLTIKEEPTFMLCQEMNKLSQPPITTLSKHKVSSNTTGRDTIKLRMKARDPRRALVGTMLDKDDLLSFNLSKEAGKMDPSSSTTKHGAGDLERKPVTDTLPTPSVSLPNKKEMNENAGPHSAKQEFSNHWEGVEHLLEGLDEKQCHAFRQERARRIEEQNRMLRAKKLCLVLDLDHTLLNSAKFTEIEVEWENRLRANETAECVRTMKEASGKRELYRFPHMGMWTKLRPGIWNFLARASQLYELHVYTMGNKVYAREMAKLLDPTGTLFAERVISKGDDGDLVDGDERLPKSKDLDGVLGMESAVVIIDDSVRVWPHHRHNLIVVERYMYFPCSRRQFGLTGPSLLEVGHDEREADGMLASALLVIEKIHFSFFSRQRLHEVDVRDVLATEQRKVLAGCKILFSRVFPQGESQPQLHPLWKMAEQFGAVCTTGMDEGITHVVAISLGTDKVNWALATGRFVVRPAWLEASAILYRRVNEWDYPVPP